MMPVSSYRLILCATEKRDILMYFIRIGEHSKHKLLKNVHAGDFDFEGEKVVEIAIFIRGGDLGLLPI